jgi:threonine dehydrogenase-like Zn-dependent dehydrogenase
MGFECMQVARNCGAGRIITVDVREEACQKSLELGADTSINAKQEDPVAAIRDLTEGNGADVVFECAGGSPRQGLSGSQTLTQAIDAVRSGGKIIGVSWFGEPFPLDIDLLRERSLRYLFPDISTAAHLEHTVRLVASGRVQLKPMITHILPGIESVPQAFEITANKGKYKAISPAQVVL